MIWSVLIDGIVWVLNVLFSWVPKVTALPMNIDDALLSAVMAWNTFIHTYFWPLEIMWTSVLLYIEVLFAIWVLRLLRIIR